MKNIKDKTLEELEGESWGEPPYNSHLVTTCHRLRKVPLAQFTIEDLRIMIGQSFGVKYLLPMALDALKSEPLIQGDYYPGDLLSAVLNLKQEVWKEYPEYRAEVERIIDSITDIPNEIRDAIEKFQEQ